MWTGEFIQLSVTVKRAVCRQCSAQIVCKSVSVSALKELQDTVYYLYVVEAYESKHCGELASITLQKSTGCMFTLLVFKGSAGTTGVFS